MLPAGRRNQRITLLRAVATVDALNTPIGTWAVLATVWAARLGRSTAERLASAEVGAVSTVRWRIRRAKAWADLSARDRVRDAAGTEWNIAGVDPVGDEPIPRELDITATARTERLA